MNSGNTFPRNMFPKFHPKDNRYNDLLSKCKVLFDYVIFHQRIRDNIISGMTREKAVEAAVDSCICDGILEELLRKERAKLMASILSEFDQEEYEEMIRRESKEDGMKDGMRDGIRELLEELGTISEQLEKEIQEQENWEILKKWLKLAARVSTIEEFEEKRK